MEKKRCCEKVVGSLILIGFLVTTWLFFSSWCEYRDKMLKTIEECEEKAPFRAQIVKTDNDIAVFIWYRNGRIEGQIVNDQP